MKSNSEMKPCKLKASSVCEIEETVKDYKFQVTKVKTPAGSEYPLLVAQEYPYAQIQILPSSSKNQDERMLEAWDAHFSVKKASDGSSDFFALLAAAGGEGEKFIEINQKNYKQVVKDTSDCLQAGADFWNEFRKHHITFASNCSLSYIE